MNFYKYSVTYCDEYYNSETCHGIAIGEHLSQAIDTIINSFVDKEEKIDNISIALLSPEPDVLILEEKLLKEIEEDIIW